MAGKISDGLQLFGGQIGPQMQGDLGDLARSLMPNPEGAYRANILPAMRMPDGSVEMAVPGVVRDGITGLAEWFDAGKAAGEGKPWSVSGEAITALPASSAAAGVAMAPRGALASGAAKPIKVFQGRSRRGLTDFFNPDGNAWGSTHKPTAEQFAGKDELSKFYPEYPGEVYNLEFDIQNPMTVSYKDTLWSREKELAKIAEAKRLGHDGLRIEFSPEKTDYVAFSPDQVRQSTADESLLTLTDEAAAKLTPAERLDIAQRNAALPVEKGGLGLPPDNTPEMRAKAMGFDTDTLWYHGTTHSFPSFGGNTKNLEGHFGGGHYFTSSPVDASKNYAGEGPDLTIRMDMLAERIADDVEFDRDVSREVAERYAKWKARKELKGDNEGAVIPAYLRGETVDVRNHTRGAPTVLTSDFNIDSAALKKQAQDELGPDADEWDVMDRYHELYDEAIMDAEPNGSLAKFAESIRENAPDYDVDADAVLSRISDELMDGSIDAHRLDADMRKSDLMYAEDYDNGGLVGNDIIRRAFNDAGYPNILMDAKSAFPNMPNIPEGTLHKITSDPRNIRSRFAAFDPARKDSADLLAANPASGGLLAAPQIIEHLRQIEEDKKKGPLARSLLAPGVI